MSSTGAGVLLALGATAAFETGYLLLAAQARRVASSEPGLRLLARLVRRRWWLTAMALNAVGFVLELLALRRVSLLVVQPMLSFGLVGLAVGSRLILGEQAGVRQIAAAAVIGAGIIVVVIGAPAQARTATLGFGVASVIVVVTLLAALGAGATQHARSPWSLVLAAAAGDTLVALATNEIAREWTARPFAALLAIATVAVCGIAAITSESAALQRLPASRVGPIVSSAQVVLPVTIVALLGHEQWSGTPGHGAALAAGTALVAAGAFVLARSRTAIQPGFEPA